jgi:small subunit ribosomal protein S3
MILVHCARPGVLIGRKGVKVDALKKQLESMTGKDITLNIHEVTRPELSAQLVAESVAEQIERRASYRRALKRAMQLTMERGAKGIKIRIGGRLGGSEIARVQTQLQGSIPLTTLTADIDYGFAEARCSYGRTGVKVWIYKGSIRRGPAISRGR